MQSICIILQIVANLYKYYVQLLDQSFNLRMIYWKYWGYLQDTLYLPDDGMPQLIKSPYESWQGAFHVNQNFCELKFPSPWFLMYYTLTAKGHGIHIIDALQGQTHCKITLFRQEFNFVIVARTSDS